MKQQKWEKQYTPKIWLGPEIRRIFFEQKNQKLLKLIRLLDGVEWIDEEVFDEMQESHYLYVEI